MESSAPFSDSDSGARVGSAGDLDAFARFQQRFGRVQVASARHPSSQVRLAACLLRGRDWDRFYAMKAEYDGLVKAVFGPTTSQEPLVMAQHVATLGGAARACRVAVKRAADDLTPVFVRLAGVLEGWEAAGDVQAGPAPGGTAGLRLDSELRSRQIRELWALFVTGARGAELLYKTYEPRPDPVPTGLFDRLAPARYGAKKGAPPSSEPARAGGADASPSLARSRARRAARDRGSAPDHADERAGSEPEGGPQARRSRAARARRQWRTWLSDQRQIRAFERDVWSDREDVEGPPETVYDERVHEGVYLGGPADTAIAALVQRRDNILREVQRYDDRRVLYEVALAALLEGGPAPAWDRSLAAPFPRLPTCEELVRAGGVKRRNELVWPWVDHQVQLARDRDPSVRGLATRLTEQLEGSDELSGCIDLIPSHSAIRAHIEGRSRG